MRELIRFGAARVAVGACEPCSRGGACSCSTPCSQKAVGELPGLIERGVPWSQVTELDLEIRNYGTDVGKWAQDTSQWGTTTGAEVVKYKIAWDNFYTGWRVWFDVESQPSFWDILPEKYIAGEDLVIYDRKIVEYKELYREGTETFKIKTTAKFEEPKPPIDLKQISIDLANKAKAAAEGAGKAIEWGFYIVVAAGVGFAALLLYPAVAPVLGGAVSRARAA